jgi:short/branched chain acyl-CoA dehydrogenase
MTTGFELSREHEEFRRSVREFAEAEIAPHAAQWDREHHFPVHVVQQMGKLGLFGLTAPEEFGGAGMAGEDGGFTSLCLAIEEIGRVDQSMGITLEAGVGLGINPILTYGTAEQKERWLPELVAGEQLAGFGLTEPGAGSDAGATRTRAELSGGEWVLNGAKQFITNSGSSITSLVTVTARTGAREDPSTGSAGTGRPEISAIMVPSDTPGFTAEKAYDKLGWHASDTHPLSFEDARVPAENLLGERGRGYAQFLATLDDGRVAISALAVGCIQACLEMSVAYAGERQTFGGPIGRKQGVAFQIADLEVLLHTSRLLTYRAAAIKDAMDAGGSGAPTSAEFKQAAAVAKLHATESAVTATRIATQVFGGYGFMEEYPVARFYRDAKVLEVGEGTSEVQRMLIARGLGLPVE